MKLNHDCVRDVMIALEKHLTLDNIIYYEKFTTFEETKSYSIDDIIYSLLKLREAGFIHSNNNVSDNRPQPFVTGITYEGHNFLDNVRDNTVWKNAKEKAFSTVSSVSIAIVNQVAGAYIKNKLGL